MINQFTKYYVDLIYNRRFYFTLQGYRNKLINFNFVLIVNINE